MTLARLKWTLVLVAGLAIGALPQAAGAVPTGYERSAASGPENPEWQQQSPLRSPPPYVGAAMAYDATGEQMVMFGGVKQRGEVGGTSSLTWAWDGTNWARLHPSRHPPPRAYHDLALDPVRNEVVLFGGRNTSTTLEDTWVFAAGEWTRRTPVNAPPRLFDAAMAFDPNSQQMILLAVTFEDGDFVSRTWAWDGTNWTLLVPATSPPAQPGGELAYDPTRGGLVLFGGDVNETWLWTGETWQLQSVLRSPPPRRYPVLATLDDTVVLFGGVYEQPRSDTWILTDTSWRRILPAPEPKSRGYAAHDWDPVRRELVLFGGAGRFVAFDDTWDLTPASP